MDDEKTVLMRSIRKRVKKPICDISLEVSFNAEDGSAVTKSFVEKFTIGRHSECELTLLDGNVSRHHVELYPALTRWVARDLGSTNSTYLNGKIIKESPLPNRCVMQLGDEGPVITLQQISNKKEEEAQPEKKIEHTRPGTKEEIIAHYLDESRAEKIGEHTLLVRSVIKQEKKKQSRRYVGIIAAIAGLLVLMTSVVVFQQFRLNNARNIAVDMFYDMKSLEVQISQTELNIQTTGRLSQIADVSRKRVQLTEMNRKYQNYLDELESFRWLKGKASEKERIILNVARQFGECEVELPDGFVAEVDKYIEKWKSSDRFSTAIQRMERNNYQKSIISSLTGQSLPIQFAYLPLQESNYRHDAIGPETRFGIAKGAWQFIPATATQYGLKIGPLASVRKFDPADERFDFEKASQAAALYLKNIYSQEAQASGLLVLASYNWGDNRVRKLIRKMPDNPKERNFWKLIEQYKIPQETHDYVFYIFSAAVIAENPGLFGFDFDNPFKNL